MDIDQADSKNGPNNGEAERFTLGMGCFWTPEALFGAMPGVLCTRVGYAGGKTDKPSYREMGDHTECVQLEFDSGKVAFEELVAIFWERHQPININGYKGRQYQSLLVYENERQRAAIERVLHNRERSGLGRPETDIVPCSAFYVAEERHQKYYLKRYPQAIEALSARYPSPSQLQDSTIAARLNGLAKGYTSMERIKNEIEAWQISDGERSDILSLISSIRW
ncbi:peptide-methionine (S)-S-oxide reductase [Paenibacillus sp. 1011MAR3C5]|uniref:peptide-methionine (S)-S-oxide reductase MsrA n=1 Tax=Paenibacillus sp. 1011MAR3C5 TaxID=1675787 RepID=UPI000E6D1D15|nr:peptide-methionine (S)-S-oxide reductase [Paenibacillus sp. 1011MAR3C5]RJE84392.1 peptide-methionine (S)-S-oxide reductase [Paenibacillus sp. 1011MAR3C5]